MIHGIVVISCEGKRAGKVASEGGDICYDSSEEGRDVSKQTNEGL